MNSTHLIVDWDTDPADLALRANVRIGTVIQEVPVTYSIGEIISFQVIVSPASEGEGYYMFILYRVVADTL